VSPPIRFWSHCELWTWTTITLVPRQPGC
jgi:hypothetical protein